jgi:hypothetical protein
MARTVGYVLRSRSRGESAPVRSVQFAMQAGHAVGDPLPPESLSNFRRSWANGGGSTLFTAAYRLSVPLNGDSPPATILEIGSARDAFGGVRPTGSSRAATNAVFRGTLQSAIDPTFQQFGLVVAFEAYEHLTVQNLSIC